MATQRMIALPGRDDRPRRVARIETRDVGGETMLYDPVSQYVTALNDVGGVVWSLCDGQRSLVAIAAEIANATGAAPDVVTADVARFVAALGGFGWLDWQASGTGTDRLGRLRQIIDAVAMAALHETAAQPGAAPGFVATPLSELAEALVAIAARRRRLVDLGCGLGGGALLAAALGMSAVGIEADPGLVAAARRLARDLALPVEFVHGDALPNPWPWPEDTGTPEWSAAWASYRHGDAPAAPVTVLAGCDAWLATPWPGTAVVVARLFERLAAPGAVLITYCGTGEVTMTIRGAGQLAYRGAGDDAALDAALARTTAPT